jgi:hypothetical protein
LTGNGASGSITTGQCSDFQPKPEREPAKAAEIGSFGSPADITAERHSMKDISEKNFGPLIAFCLPGFILLLALSYSFPDLKNWLAISSSKDGASIGGFLYTTFASLSLGLLLSGLRWATVDQVLEREFWIVGKALPKIDFKGLDNKDTLVAFFGIVENHYRYYQYYSNSLVAVELGGLSYLWNVGRASVLQWILAIFLIGILFAASRDCFRKYYIRGAAVTTRRTGNDERREEVEEQGEKDGEEDQEGGKEEVVVVVKSAASNQPPAQLR